MVALTKIQLFAIMCVAVLAIWSGYSCVRPWVTNPHPVEATKAEYIRDSNDLSGNISEMAATPTFMSTFAYWHEGMLPTVPYWRPLTCQFGWLENRFLGTYRFDRWMWVSYVIEVLFVLAYGSFVFVLTRNVAVTVTSVAIWSCSRTWLHFLIHAFPAANETPIFMLLRSVKFQPDLCANTFIFTALTLLCLRTWSGALVCTAIAICFKESGWLAFPLGLIVLTATGRLKSVPTWMYPATVVTIAVLVAFRLSAGSAVAQGFHMGTNMFWYSRYANAVEGTLLINSQVYPAETLLAATIYLLYRVRKLQRPIIILAVICSVIPACGIVAAHAAHCPFLVGVDMLLDPSVFLPAVLASLTCMVGMDALIRDKDLRGYALLAIALALVAALQFVAATQILTHALVSALAFQSVFVALACVATAKRFAAANHTLHNIYYRNIRRS